MVKREEYFFFTGVLIAILGNYLVSCLVESLKTLIEDAPFSHTLLWATGFIVNSVVVFQVAKQTMQYMYKTTKSKLRAFDFLAVGFVIFGILMIVSSAIGG